MNANTKTKSSVSVLDLARAIKDLEARLDKNINTYPLYTEVGMQIVLIALHAHVELKRHTAPGPISVQVVKGRVSFRTDDGEHELDSTQLLTLEAQVPHCIYAHQRSIVLVTKSIPQ